MQGAVVVGARPSAGLVAAVLAARGARVVLVEAEGADGEPPWGAGICAAAGEELVRGWGAAVEVDDLGSGALLGGEILDLPLGWLGVLARRRLAAGVPDLLRVRATAALGGVLTRGRELRDAGRWLDDRFGPAVARGVLGGWMRRRWGAPPAELAPWVGWWSCGRTPPERRFAPAGGQDALVERQHAAVTRAGGEVLRARPEGLAVEGGRVRALRTSRGDVPVDGALFAEVAPATLGAWLGEALDAEARADLGRVRSAHAAQITLPAAAERLPWSVQLLDERPAWRVTRPGLLPGEERWVGHVTVHLTFDEGDPRWRAGDEELVAVARAAVRGLVEPRPGETLVQRRAGGVPIVGVATVPARARLQDALDRLGVAAVGARGSGWPMDPAGEAGHAGLVADAAPEGGVAQAAARRAQERPARLPARASLRSLVGE